MLKMIIADDEPVICSLIRNLINWESEGFEVIGMAYTGIDAFQMIMQQQPDVVISDIRMPGYDGLELIRRTREAGLETEFVMISGFRQFEYAQTAMKYGVKYYLLKPIEEEALAAIALEIRENLEKKQKSRDYQNSLERQLAQDRDRMKHRLLTTLMTEGSGAGSVSRDDANAEYSTNFAEGYYRAVFVKVDVLSGGEYYLKTVLEHLRHITDDAFSFCEEKISMETHSGCMILFNYQPEFEETVKKAVETLHETCSRYLSQFEGLSPVVGVGCRESDFYQSRDCIRTAVDAVKYRVQVKEEVIYAEEYSFAHHDIQKIVTPERKQEFKKDVEAGDSTSAEGIIRDIFRKVMFSAEHYSPIVYYELAVCFKDLIIEIWHDHGYEQKELKDRVQEFELNLDAAGNIERILSITQQFIRDTVSRILFIRKEHTTKPIRVIKEYLEAHYMEELNLNQLSDLVDMNASYISSMFKKETGLSYLEYLTDIRIQKAKELLINTSDNIEVIAEKIGYHTGRYFSKQFVKTVGLKPFEYRRLYS